MADPSAVSIVIPAFNEGPAIADVVSALKAAASWHEIIVVDDGSHDDTAARARAAGACVIRHPYNKGNGAAVKSGIRSATGEFVLIMDGDGQHRPEDAQRLVAKLGEYDLVIGSRSASTQATQARRFGNSALNGLASYLTGRSIPGPHVGVPCAHAASSSASSSTCCPTGSRRRRPPRWRSSRPATTSRSSRPTRGRAVGHVEDPAGARRQPVPADHPQDRHAVQPAACVPADQPACRLRWAPATRCGRFTRESHVTNSSVLLIMFAVIVFLVGLISEQISALRFEGRR